MAPKSDWIVPIIIFPKLYLIIISYKLFRTIGVIGKCNELDLSHKLRALFLRSNWIGMALYYRVYIRIDKLTIN